MNNPIQQEPEMQELKRGRSIAAAPQIETNDELPPSTRDADTMLSMTVLLLACLALAALAHVFVS
jgi:hypothetical protein